MICFFFPLIALLMLRVGKERIWDSEHFVSWNRGTGRIIISVPHGGSLKPSFIPDRVKHGCLTLNGTCEWTPNCHPKIQKKCNAVMNQDVNTIPIALKLYDTLKDMGLSPHLILVYLHRAKLDVNRPINNAAQGNEFAQAIYKVFHQFIESARKTIEGPGLYVEIHGQSHRENWTEIGYRITTEDLINGRYSAFNSSIRALALRSNTSTPHDLITGANSFGTILEQSGVGYKVVPGAKIPKPNLGGYYQGGYNTLMYGSLNSGQIDAIQIEITSDIRLKREQVYKEFASNLAQSINQFMKIHRYYG